MEEVRKAMLAMTNRAYESQLAFRDKDFKKCDALFTEIEVRENDD